MYIVRQVVCIYYRTTYYSGAPWRGVPYWSEPSFRGATVLVVSSGSSFDTYTHTHTHTHTHTLRGVFFFGG